MEIEKEKDRNALFKEFYYRGVSNSAWELLPSLSVNDLEFYEPVMIEELKKHILLGVPRALSLKEKRDVYPTLFHRH